MSKTTVSQQPAKRVKVTLACVVCRKKKVRCDGIQPACSRCQSVGACCQYSDPPKKRGPPKGYVEVIESRVHRIESLLGGYQQQQQQPILRNPDINVFPTIKPANSMLSLIAGRVDALEHHAHGSNGIIPDYTMHDQLSWTNHYFDYFNCIFPVLSKSQFVFQLENSTLNPLLKLAVFALGSRLQGGMDGQEANLVAQFDSLISHDILFPEISTLQALAIMCWYTHLTGNMHKCYSLRHCLACMSHKLNLRYESANESQDMHLTEMKRRAYWVCFVLDQWLANCTGTESFFTSESDCKQPQLEESQLSLLFAQQQQQPELSLLDTFESAFQITSFREMIRLATILSNIADRHPHQSESSLTEWLLKLPSYLDFNNAQACKPTPLTRMFRILYYTAQIMINNKQFYHTLSSSICTTAASTIIHISEHMLASGEQRYLSNLFFISLTLATSVHLDNAVANTKDNAPDKVNLLKGASLMKELNITVLPRSELNKLIDCFLMDKCDVSLEFVYPSPSSSVVLPVQKKTKRSFAEMESDLLLVSPPSTPVTADHQSVTSQHMLIESFDINHLLSIDEWPADWTHMLDQSSCSPISYFTPSQSPSLNLEDEQTQLHDDSLFSYPFDLL
ncbi:fungal-specific transcription factor domain-containing protein [Choanephora cucurbitarum]|nr:fungal-specific transcription factor domain-containing protein [Choanephora cucurbitarum]